ncbi:MAG: acetate kinase [Desulfobacterales bacterium]|nr:MAG: acetate kinase [Desulfobacterales bacterium]
MNQDQITVQSDGQYGLALKTDRPLKLLVINCGSSSLKFAVFDTMDTDTFARGEVERIGLANTRLTLTASQGEKVRLLDDNSHQGALGAMLDTLESVGIVQGLDDIAVVAHRSTLGGEKYKGAVEVTDQVIGVMEGYIPLFPVHNPSIIKGIRLAQALLPNAVHFTVFDSSFHSTIPDFAYIYALPYAYYRDKGLRRFGYHGSSHQYASLRSAQFLGHAVTALKTIVCHLGNGASICAIDGGRSVDTTLGFSPVDGLIMGTRGGELDPGLLLHLMKVEGLQYDALAELINQKSGLLGLSGISSDMREVELAAIQGNPRACLTINAYTYRIRKYIGAYIAALEGLDALVFTGGIGQGSARVRHLACRGLSHMGIRLDEEKNTTADGFNEITDIAAKDSLVRILVIPADEERMIARETLSALKNCRCAC